MNPVASLLTAGAAPRRSPFSTAATGGSRLSCVEAAIAKPTRFALVVAYYADDGVPTEVQLRGVRDGFTHPSVQEYFSSVSYGAATLETVYIEPVAIRGIQSKYDFDSADAGVESLYNGGSYRLSNGVVVRPNGAIRRLCVCDCVCVCVALAARGRSLARFKCV